MPKDKPDGVAGYGGGMTRREVFASAALAGAGIVLAPVLGSARSAEAAEVPGDAARTHQVITKTIPRTNEALPAVGLGTYLTFDVIPGNPRDNIREVIRRFWEGGGRVVDTSPLYGTGEISVGDFAGALGITGELFIANKIWSTGKYLADDSHALASLHRRTSARSGAPCRTRRCGPGWSATWKRFPVSTGLPACRPIPARRSTASSAGSNPGGAPRANEGGGAGGSGRIRPA